MSFSGAPGRLHTENRDIDGKFFAAEAVANTTDVSTLIVAVDGSHEVRSANVMQLHPHADRLRHLLLLFKTTDRFQQ